MLQPLTRDQLQDIRQTLKLRILEGLAQESQQVACLPAFLSPPRSGLKGRALVVDAGGTNVRAALVEVAEGQSRVLKGPISGTLPDGREHPVEAAEFFGYQAGLLQQLGTDREPLPLGYCFSYAARVEPDGDARLLHWTKGIRVSGVQGERVGAALSQAAGLGSAVRVLNDTVACLLGGAYWAGTEAARSVGLIVGTGTNMAAFFPAAQVDKLQTSWEGLLAVNLESGNFHPPHLSPADDAVDAASDNPGRQRYEKAVSGFYLPYLLAQLCPQLEMPPEVSSQWVVEWSERQGPAAEAARWLLQRSADLVAAGLAGLADCLGTSHLVVQAEGGLFWKAPGYAARVEQQLTALLGSCRIARGDEVNLVGAAVAALQGT